MMDAIVEPGVEEVTFMTAGRVGKTTILENILGYYIDYDPSPILIIQPTDLKARRFSKLNLGPMIRDNAALARRVAAPNSRDAAHEILYKAFEGGHIVVGGANAPTSLSAYSMRIVLFDPPHDTLPIRIWGYIILQKINFNGGVTAAVV